MSNEIYFCKRLRLCNFLMSKGFKVKEIIQDPTTIKNYKWWIFDKTDELMAAIEEYYALPRE